MSDPVAIFLISGQLLEERYYEGANGQIAAGPSFPLWIYGFLLLQKLS
jgi:hypothetical protein